MLLLDCLSLLLHHLCSWSWTEWEHIALLSSVCVEWHIERSVETIAEPVRRSKILTPIFSVRAAGARVIHALIHIRSNFLPLAAVVKHLIMWHICCHSDCVSQIGGQIVSNTSWIMRSRFGNARKISIHSLRKSSSKSRFTLTNYWSVSTVHNLKTYLMLCNFIAEIRIIIKK